VTWVLWLELYCISMRTKEKAKGMLEKVRLRMWLCFWIGSLGMLIKSIPLLVAYLASLAPW
jgi:hypothetical protein